ncbi:MAG: carboxypeptidase regulatory-like domain-containing protein [Pyrinomonadaceae bacterium]
MHSKYTNILFILLLGVNVLAQSSQNIIVGKITDQNGDLINEAEVTLIDSNKNEVKTTTDGNGGFIFKSILEGKYTLVVEKQGFANYENNEILVNKNTTLTFNLTLKVKLEDTKVDITEDPNVPSISNPDTLVFTEKELGKLLPDEPEEIEKFLKNLAGDAGGPDGASIYVDGFLTNKVPPKTAIGEVRIDNNAFSAEYEKIGSGAINIFTKISSRKLSGSVNATFNDESFNARNPFSLVRGASQLRTYGGRISSAFLKKKAAFSLNITKREFDDQRYVNAVVLDENYNSVLLRSNYLMPVRKLNFSGNTDFQLAKDKTLRLSYELYKDSRKNQGIGNLNLFSTGGTSTSTDSIFRLSQTSVIQEKLINEFRFQFEKTTNESEGIGTNPQIITDTFISGNPSIGKYNQTSKNFEINNILTFEVNNFTIRAGGSIRIKSLSDYSPENFGGTYVFNGGFGPKLVNGIPVIGNNGQAIIENISGLESYRRTVMFSAQGLTPQQIRALGGGVSQFSINTGDPLLSLNQIESGLFFQTTWKIRPNLNLGLGARYDVQTNLSRNTDISPRLMIAWSPSENKKATVIRGGIGWYYDRVPLSLRLQPGKIQSGKIQSYLTNDSVILDSFSNPLGIGNLGALTNSQLQMTFSPNLRSAFSFQAAISLEQQLPHKWKFISTFTENNTRGLLRSRNIADFALLSPINIYQYESNGRFDSKTLTARISKQFKDNSLFINYWLGSAKSDTDGAQTFPVKQFDVSNEYGSASSDTRHHLYFGGYLTMPFNISLSPSISIRSGTPFNITLGQDLNHDSIFTDRPAFADGKTGINIISTKWGDFDLNPTDSSRIIPRNFGRGVGTISMDLDISRRFTVFKNKGGTRQVSLNLGSQIINVLNHTNPANPIGVLTSPFFGKSISDNSQGIYSGARTITFNARLSF